jgi:hypothetical protein
MKLLSPDDLKPKGAWFSNQYRLELEREGKYPRRVKTDARRYGYFEHEIDRWLEERAALRDTVRRAVPTAAAIVMLCAPLLMRIVA